MRPRMPKTLYREKIKRNGTLSLSLQLGISNYAFGLCPRESQLRFKELTDFSQQCCIWIFRGAIKHARHIGLQISVKD